MGNIFSPIARANDGGVVFNIGTGLLVDPVDYNGLRLDSAGAIYAVNNGTINHYHEGLPFNIHGRLVVSNSEVVNYFDQGLGFSINGNLVISSSPDHYDQGVWFDDESALSTVGGTVGSIALWILSLLGFPTSSTSTVTNGTAEVWLNDAVIGDGLTLVSIPDSSDIGLQDGARYNDTVDGGARTGDELVVNGDFSDGTTGWVGQGATITTVNGWLEVSGEGGSQDRATNAGLVEVNAGATVQLQGEMEDVDGENSLIIFFSKPSFTDIGRLSVPGTFNSTATIPAGDTTIEIWLHNGTTGSTLFDNISVKQIIPTYSWNLADGTPVAKYTNQQTDNGTVPTLDPLAMVPWAAVEAVVVDDIRRVSTTEGLDCWVRYNGAGNTNATQPTVSITDIGGSAITDGTASFLVKGLQTVTGLFSGLAATNLLIYSEEFDNPAWAKTNLTISANAIISPNGETTADGLVSSTLSSVEHYTTQSASASSTYFGGSFFAKAGDVSWAVITLFNESSVGVRRFVNLDTGDVGVNDDFNSPTDPTISTSYAWNGWWRISASQGSSVITTVTSRIGPAAVDGAKSYIASDTVTPQIYVWGGTAMEVQLISPYIPTVASTVTRAATVTSTPITDTALTTEAGYGVIVARPSVAGQTGYLVSSYIDATHETLLSINATTMQLIKDVAGGSIASISYTHNTDPFAIIYSWDSTGMQISAIDVGGVLPIVGTNASTTDAVLGTLLETGSRNSLNQFQGDILFNGTFDSWEQAVAYIDDNNLADTSNL